MNEKIIEVKNLCKSFESVQVLRGITIDINRGDVLCVIGASGSGKSTFLRCLNLLETAQSGEIKFSGEYLFKNERMALLPELEAAKAALKGLKKNAAGSAEESVYKKIKAKYDAPLHLVK